MLRKQIIKATPANPVPPPGAIDIAAVATVLATSEAPDHPSISPPTPSGTGRHSLDRRGAG